MKVHESMWPSSRKKTSRHDQHELRKEAVEGDFGFENEVEKLRDDLDKVIQKYFPEEFESFKPPTFSRLVQSYEESINQFRDQEDFDREYEGEENSRAFLAAAAIRYVDDFIDNCLWLYIKEYDPEIIRQRFSDFLHNALEITREYDPEMPDEILRLPTLEMEFALNPSQEFFDENIHKIFEYKSFDLAYVEQQYFGATPRNRMDKMNRWLYLGASAKDFSRDFTWENYTKESDFNIRNHIVENELNPDFLIDYVKTILKKINNEIFEVFVKGGGLEEFIKAEEVEGIHYDKVELSYCYDCILMITELEKLKVEN